LTLTVNCQRQWARSPHARRAPVVTQDGLHKPQPPPYYIYTLRSIEYVLAAIHNLYRRGVLASARSCDGVETAPRLWAWRRRWRRSSRRRGVWRVLEAPVLGPLQEPLLKERVESLSVPRCRPAASALCRAHRNRCADLYRPVAMPLSFSAKCTHLLLK
jgi:hypothetical protein